MATPWLLRTLAIASTFLVSPLLTVTPVQANTSEVTDTDTVVIDDSELGFDTEANPDAPNGRGSGDARELAVDGGTNTDGNNDEDVERLNDKPAGDTSEVGTEGSTDSADGSETTDESLRPSEELTTTDDVLDALADELYEVLEADVAEELLEDVTDDGQVRVIVTLAVDTKLEDTLSQRDVAQQRKDIADTAEKVLESVDDKDVDVVHQLSVVPALVVEVTPEGLLDLMASDAVESVAIDLVLERTSSVQLSPHSPHLSHFLSPPTTSPSMTLALAQQQVSPLHDAGFLGQGATIAVLDDGVDKNHPFFFRYDDNGTAVGTRIIAEACFSSATAETRSFCPEVAGVARNTPLELSNDPDAALPCSDNDCYHGTHVAGIAAGGPSIRLNGDPVSVSGSTFTGVAPEADVVAIQVFHEKIAEGGGSGGIVAFSSDILAGLEWVYRHREVHNTQVVNMSLGFGRFNDPATCDAGIPQMTSMINNLAAAGIPTVVASGNNGWSDSLSYPACISSAWAIGSTLGTEDRVSSFSNIHPTMLDLYAVGSSVASAFPANRYAILSGTSMAAPQVAGAVAVLKSAHPTTTPQQLLTVLKCTGPGVSLGAPNVALGFSHPRLDVAAAHSTPCPTVRPQVTREDQRAIVTLSQAPASLAPIQQYQAQCTASGQATRTAQGASTTLTVSSLTSGVSYDCAMRAQSIGGTWSAWSVAQVATPQVHAVAPATRPSRPGRPTVERGNRTATVTVRAPASNGTAITQYQARCTAPGQRTRRASTTSSTGTSSTITLTKLRNNVRYTCQSRVRNEAGWSAWSNTRAAPAVSRPAQPNRPRVTRANGTARVVVAAPASNGSPITRYQARCSASGQATRTARSSSRAVTVRNLRNNVEYSCQTRARNDLGWSPWSTARVVSPVARPARPARPTVTRASQAAKVTVSAPASNGSKVTRYQARCRAPGESTQRTNNTRRAVTVRNLQPGVTYSCQIRARNAIGWSPWSAPRDVRPRR